VETLKRLKRGAVLAIVMLLVLGVVAFLAAHAAKKSVNNKYAETIAAYEDEIKALNDEHNKMVRTYTNVSTEVDLSLLTMKATEIAELATMEYHYTDAGRFTDGKALFGFDLPFLKKSFTAKWEGVIKAGIDMDQVTFSVDETNHVLTVGLPEATILSHEILTDSIETLDETKNVFNPISVNDVRKFDATSKEEMETRAEESGLLEKARENAENVISKMFYQTPSIYTIQFEALT